MFGVELTHFAHKFVSKSLAIPRVKNLHYEVFHSRNNNLVYNSSYQAAVPASHFFRVSLIDFFRKLGDGIASNAPLFS